MPRELRTKLGATRLDHSLKTDNLAIAEPHEVANATSEFREDLGEARGGMVAARNDPLLEEALEIARLRTRAKAREIENPSRRAASGQGLLHLSPLEHFVPRALY
jgi:hypothetical protein